MSGGARDEGSVSVEFALALPAVVVLLALALGCVRWAIDEVVAHDAAATAARVALVDGAVAAAAAVHAIAPAALVHGARDGTWWVIRVTIPVPGPFPDAVATARAYQP